MSKFKVGDKVVPVNKGYWDYSTPYKIVEEIRGFGGLINKLSGHPLLWRDSELDFYNEFKTTCCDISKYELDLIKNAKYCFVCGKELINKITFNQALTIMENGGTCKSVSSGLSYRIDGNNFVYNQYKQSLDYKEIKGEWVEVE